MARRKAAKVIEGAPVPNIVFIGKDKDGQLDLSQAPKKINDGMDTIQLPDPESQAEPFYHEQAARIIAVSQLYKKFTAKDGKPVQAEDGEVDPDQDPAE